MSTRPLKRAVSALLSGLSLLLTLTGCAGLAKPWSPPEVMVVSLRPQQIGLEEQTLLVGLRIRNPNDRTLPIKAMTYRLWLDGEEVAAGGGALERQIPAFGEEQVEVSVTANAVKLAARLPLLALRPGPLPYRVSGTVTVAGLLALPYRHSGEIDPQRLLRAVARG